jgi:hypothetical protein
MELVDVTVYYLEMLTHPQRSVPPPRDGLCASRHKTNDQGIQQTALMKMSSSSGTQ